MHKGLYAALIQALERAEQTSPALLADEMQRQGVCGQQVELRGALSTEGLLVGLMLKRDFERNGNHLGGADQCHLAELTERSLRLGMAFGEKNPHE